MARDRNKQWKKSNKRQRKGKVVHVNTPSKSTMQFINSTKAHRKCNSEYCENCGELYTHCWCHED